MVRIVVRVGPGSDTARAAKMRIFRLSTSCRPGAIQMSHSSAGVESRAKTRVVALVIRDDGCAKSDRGRIVKVMKKGRQVCGGQSSIADWTRKH